MAKKTQKPVMPAHKMPGGQNVPRHPMMPMMQPVKATKKKQEVYHGSN